MDPERVKRSLFERVNWVPEKNGCFPVALAGVFAFNYPAMTEKETVNITKELLKPIQKGEALHQHIGKKNFYNPYDFIDGVGYWHHLSYFGFGEALKHDVNSRLSSLNLNLQMDFIPSDHSIQALRLLQHGATIIPSLAVYREGKRTEFHSICFGLFDGKVYAVDVNNDLREKTLESVKYLLTDLSYREPYFGPPGTQIGGSVVQTIVFEKMNSV